MKNTTSNTWTFGQNTITVNDKTFPAKYSVARGGDIYVFTTVKSAPDAPEMPIRIHIAQDMPIYADAIAAAKADPAAKPAEDKPAPVQDKPAPVQDKPAKTEPATKSVEDKPATAKRSHKSKGIRRPEVPAQPVQDKPAKAKPATKPAEDKPAAAPVEKPWIGTVITGKGWNIAFDQQAGRTRVLFQDQPSDAQKAAIESAGFYWSARMSSWNKGLTCKAYRAAQNLAAALNALA